MPSSQIRANPQASAWVALMLLLLIAAGSYIIFEQGREVRISSGEGETQTPAILPTRRLALSPPNPLSGQSVQMSAAMGDCPRASAQLTLDGRPLSFDWSEDGSRISTQFSAASGTHRLELISSRPDCSEGLDVMVQAMQCTGRETARCVAAPGNCPGMKTCQDGRWSACSLSPNICRPGERVPCSSDSCKFGIAICDRCGTGWSPCVPPELIDQKP